MFHFLIEEPSVVLELPRLWITSVPAIRNRRLNGFRLAKVTLARGMRPG